MIYFEFCFLAWSFLLHIQYIVGRVKLPSVILLEKEQLTPFLESIANGDCNGEGTVVL